MALPATARSAHESQSSCGLVPRLNQARDQALQVLAVGLVAEPRSQRRYLLADHRAPIASSHALRAASFASRCSRICRLIWADGVSDAEWICELLRVTFSRESQFGEAPFLGEPNRSQGFQFRGSRLRALRAL